MGQLGMPDPTKYITDFDDFHRYAAGDWTVTATGSGSVALTSANGPGGVLLITNAAADNDLQQIQRAVESFKFTAGKKLWFRTRMKLKDAGTDVTQSDVFAGLIITDATLEASAPSDGVYFHKADGTAGTIEFITTMNSSATTTSAVGTFVTNVFINLAFYFDGANSLEVYVDAVKVATVAVVLGTTLVDDEELAPTFCIQNGEAVIKVIAVDYVAAITER